MLSSRSVVLILLTLAGSVTACFDAPPRTPTVLINMQGGGAVLVFTGYETTAVAPGDFCGVAINVTSPILSVGGVAILDAGTTMPLSQFGFSANATVSSSFGMVSPGVWSGFFSNVTGVVPASQSILIVASVSLVPGTTYTDLEMALRSAGAVIATDEVDVTGAVQGTAQFILPAGCMRDITTSGMSHSTDSTFVQPGNSAACATGMGAGPHVDNGYVRTYRPADFGFVAPADVQSITFGVEFAAAGPGLGSQPAEIRLYLDPTPGDPAPFGDLVLIHTELLSIADSGPMLLTQPITAASPITLMPSDDLVVEIFTPDGTGAGHNFRIGSNDRGQTSPSYIIAPGCLGNDPVDLALLGLPNMHLILDVNFAGSAPPPPPTCMITPPVPPTRAEIAIDVDTTTAACPEVDLDFLYSTDGGLTFDPCTPAGASALSNPAQGVLAGSASFLWDSIADAVGLMGPVNVAVAAVVSDDVYFGPPIICLQNLTVDNSALCTMLCGDCDLNGSMPDVLDSLTSAQIAVAILVPTIPQTGCCDVDSDSDIDVLDSLQIAQGAVSLPVTLTCP